MNPQAIPTEAFAKSLKTLHIYSIFSKRCSFIHAQKGRHSTTPLVLTEVASFVVMIMPEILEVVAMAPTVTLHYFRYPQPSCE